MRSAPGGQVDERAGRPSDDVDAVMAAALVLVGMSAQSVAAVNDVVSLPQLRILVMVASRGALNLAAVAAGLGVHSSNATRAVERLVVAGLLDRQDDPADRRNLLLELTASGRELVDRVMDHRRAAVTRILDGMAGDDRRALGAALSAFATAAGEVADDAVWSLGWPSPARTPDR
jgi:DNA-binding MarR family transcriptional regulator